MMRSWLLLLIPAILIPGYWLFRAWNLAPSQLENWQPPQRMLDDWRHADLSQSLQAIPNPASESPLLRDGFPRDGSTWTLLADATSVASSEQTLEALGILSVRRQEQSVLRFTRGQGVLTKVVPVNPQQTLELSIQARVHPTESSAAPPNVPLTAVPIHTTSTAAALLQSQSLLQLLNDPQRTTLCYGKPPPMLTVGPIAVGSELSMSRFRFRTPLDAKALLLVLDASNLGPTQLDLKEIALQPVPLRELLAEQSSEQRQQYQSQAKQLANNSNLWTSLSSFGLNFAPTDPAGFCSAINLLGETRTGRLLAPPGGITWTTEVPDSAETLEYARGRVFERRSGWGQHPIEIELYARAENGSETLLDSEELRQEPRKGWVERRVSIRRFRGQSVQFRLATNTQRSTDPCRRQRTDHPLDSGARPATQRHHIVARHGPL